MDSIEKNRLDLAYHRQLYLLNFILLIGVGTIISLAISIIQNPNKWFNYSATFVVIGIVTLIFYYNVDENLKKISLKIRQINS